MLWSEFSHTNPYYLPKMYAAWTERVAVRKNVIDMNDWRLDSFGFLCAHRLGNWSDVLFRRISIARVSATENDTVYTKAK